MLQTPVNEIKISMLQKALEKDNAVQQVKFYISLFENVQSQALSQLNLMGGI